MNAITKSFTGRKRIRKSFGRIPEIAPMPNLIDVQRASYETFLQANVSPDARTPTGLQEVFRSVFPINDFAGRGRLEFVSYEFEEPKYDVEECIQRGLTFSAPLKVILRLIVWDVDEDTGSRSIRDIKEQPVYMGDMPLMTENGTFIINGTERVIVSQMHRSPGVFFDHDKGKTHSSGKYLFAARVIPYRGSWLDFEFDAKDLIYVRIDRKRKLPVTTLLYALEGERSAAARKAKLAEGGDVDALDIKGMDDNEILSYFYGTVPFTKTAKGWARPFDADAFRGLKLLAPLVDAETGEVVAEAEAKLTARAVRKIAEKTREVLVGDIDLLGRFIAHDIVNYDTGEIYGEAGEEITEARLAALEEAGVTELPLLAIDAANGPWIRNTLTVDKNSSRDEALIDIYRVMRPGEPPTAETADAMFNGLFFDMDRYDLSSVGRVKMNMRLDVDVPDTVRVLRKEDILRTIKVMCDLKDGRGQIDDIDNLGNRRVRSVGELMENQYRVGLLRMERAIRERMGSVDIDTVMPHDLINAKPAAAAVREFFGSSQLSQFMDQTNPLSEVTHKRRLSALGPGGLTRERAGFEVRDVHPTHYGRICPIETPEGPNIGLINSLATYAKVNKYGFIETPYRLVKDGVLQDGWKYLSAMEEEKLIVAQADAKQSADGALTDDLVSVRRGGDFRLVPPTEVTACDVSPKQLVSVAAALIPFLENDDANRALMGSNMQRQAVPLVRSDAPLVGTGMEAAVAHDSGATIVAKRDGIVDQIDGARIVVRATDASGSTQGVDIYRLRKYSRSNQSTCINQRPLVHVGNQVKAGDIIADGPSTELGELALGRNVLVAFMPWNGYNFEDSILISERIAKDDVFTSIHIEEFEVMARDTKLGQEEITRDIPNVGEEALRNLDEAGIVYVGAEVNPGDILIGKVTPKGESPMTPEEKLLRAIFGEKASDVRDTSLRLPPGTTGTIVDVRVFSRRGVDKDERAMAIERAEIDRLSKDRDDERGIQERSFYSRLREKLLGQVAGAGYKGIRSGTEITDEVLDEQPRGAWRHIVVASDAVMAELETLRREFDASVQKIQARFESKVEKLQRGDELPPGVMKMVKVFVAVKRKLQPGDKMAGRHGNKGVVSRVVPVEDMPFLEDGTSVDIVLNPLGVPSRMNVGQILETHLGWACANLGRGIGDLVDDYQRNGEKRQELLDRLKDVYGDEIYSEAIANMSNDELVELGNNLRKGVPIATPVFDGASIPDIEAMLEKAGVNKSGQSQLIDGRTGEPFERVTTVGYIYMLKLHHLVDDKIHARSIGPYSLVTQQPLGGKAQFGGQRFGEMEVWALEAYGAAYTLQEMLTVKSDDVSGRTKVYEAIVREQDDFEAGIPESFNVLIKELKSLGLNVELEQGAE
ncbi:DNA-directed RNA polymerase subunit beta [Acetobacter orientalis]|uniref:DNA-directed RNA polymerase subunit beta n=3 Tax=Acetobacter orientalis TaxID=146474 RepID=A0A252C6Z8_9PROT|nr:DNA-directed RNA polymerase subunit beta [Acetobacter orientalis]MCP1221594.1 DNA-directed RNA polymerase subunit beta [Acetobacter orientalis]OUI84036.1 DNA-directed RNA polymerase subunit beta [Acetobacter orientalis]OUJ16983.1 DNA-directed RNA polymerase subunit beta [Acetobacter orientalis]GAN66999.1 DNA-directed RNA polymerase subunit beta [Acetobacter orientalis]GBR17009.1 DNA-directed RNA polymerase subunit beta [Acetobacter orientalis NRIC 0481]